MSVEAGLIGFAALTCLSLAMKKHRTRVAPGFLPPTLAARVIGGLLLGASAVAAMSAFGPSVGWVAWIGQLSIAGAFLVLLMSWRPAIAPFAAGVALAMTPLLLIWP